ncbi:MAG: type I-E CRISPR-associated protein Cas7/Cse4/CasC [Proteobacteria bacterium]|jgi:CRISPR system Cascade subunit CasC|nr:type I-E CRISPR-associated protein Cas7/Cse4/CasC [Pseudomonadota bacterium]
MFVELHIIQNFAPSCLNRDDTNSPKDCVFGGYRRARVSSQCLKRAMRMQFKEGNLIPKDQLAVRTKRIVDEIGGRLAARGKDLEAAKQVVTVALAGAELKVVEEGKTQYLLYVGEDELKKIADVCVAHWDELLALTAPKAEVEGKKKKAKEEKREAKESVPKAIRDEMTGILGSGKAADLALFGRMLADMPEKNIDAACQVAHALSTNEVAMEMDFYTAVDDLKPNDNQGADMMGVVEFTSACFYRYAVVNADLLAGNMGSDKAAAKRAVEAFLKAAIAAVPTGKQNSMAAFNPPLYVMAVVRNGGAAWNLANAFMKPVRPLDAGKDIGELSVERLGAHLAKLEAMYGADSIALKIASSSYDAKPTPVADLVKQVVETLP